MSFFGKLFARKRGGTMVGNFLRRKAAMLAPDFFPAYVREKVNNDLQDTRDTPLGGHSQLNPFE